MKVVGLKEKRRFSRINIRAPLRYQIRGKSEFDHAISDNISVGGVSFVIDKFITPLTLLMLEINFMSRTLSPVGKVIWSAPLSHSDRYKLGIEFLELDSRQKHYLADYINVNLQMGRLKREGLNGS